MTTEKNLLKLEKEIYQKIAQIKSGKLLPKDSGIGKMINLMKSLDEPTYDRILQDYKKALSLIK
jgi:hypothetical protein